MSRMVTTAALMAGAVSQRASGRARGAPSGAPGARTSTSKSSTDSPRSALPTADSSSRDLARPVQREHRVGQAALGEGGALRLRRRRSRSALALVNSMWPTRSYTNTASPRQSRIEASSRFCSSSLVSATLRAVTSRPVTTAPRTSPVGPSRRWAFVLITSPSGLAGFRIRSSWSCTTSPRMARWAGPSSGPSRRAPSEVKRPYCSKRSETPALGSNRLPAKASKAGLDSIIRPCTSYTATASTTQSSTDRNSVPCCSSSSSTRLRRVTSRATTTAPAIRPSGSWTGRALTLRRMSLGVRRVAHDQLENVDDLAAQGAQERALLQRERRYPVGLEDAEGRCAGIDGIARAGRDLGQRAGRLVEVAVAPLGVAHDDGVAQAVEHGRELPALLFCRQQGAPPLGEVARHLGEADQRAVVLADGREDAVGPEAGAVAAHAPALVLGPRLPLGLLEEPLGQAGPDRLGRVEDREVPAEISSVS